MHQLLYIGLGCFQPSLQTSLAEFLRRSMSKQQKSPALQLDTGIQLNSATLQIEHHFGVNVFLNPMVAVANNIIPDPAISNFGIQRIPFLMSDALNTLLRPKLHDNIQGSDVQTPKSDP